MEQDCQGADRNWFLQGSSSCVQERPKGTVAWVIWQLHHVPPSHRVSHQRGWAREVLPFQCAQEAPAGWRTSVHTAHRAAQCLHWAAALLVLQLKLQSWYDTSKCSVHQGWAGKSGSPDMSTRMAGPVQSPWERHYCCGHVFASHFSGSYWAHMYTGKSQHIIWQESFS